jgi:hypothetical protein
MIATVPPEPEIRGSARHPTQTSAASGVASGLVLLSSRHWRRVAPAVAALLVAGASLLAGCADDEPTSPPSGAGIVGDGATSEPAAVDASALEPDALAELVCGTGEGQELGRVQNAGLLEISGLVASGKNAGVLWAHNDSGGEPAIFAIGTDGADLGSWSVTGATNRDWEDMAGWYDAATDTNWLYLADIGDNAQGRESVTVYRVEEPVVEGGGGATAAADAVDLTYQNGPQDAEVFFVDPATGDWHVMTKGWGTGTSLVYRTPSPTGGAAAMELVGEVDLGDHGSYATGGDANGIVALRTYEEVVVWPLPGTPADALQQPLCVGPSTDERQGEAVAIAPDRTGYFTIGEGGNAAVNWFPFG